MNESLKVFVKQWTKNAEKQPGWIYLLAATYLLLYWVGVPTQIDIGRWRLNLPKFSPEIWATLLTLVLYQIGDALDKVTFKKRNKDGKWVPRFGSTGSTPLVTARGRAQDELRVRDGVYDVSMRIIEKANEAKLSVHFLNEMAKFFRSLILPALAVALVFSLKLAPPWSLILSVLELVCAYVLAYQIYPRLKNLHIANLYKTVVALPQEDRAKITSEDLGGVRLFFWEGLLLATAPQPANPGMNPTPLRPLTRTATVPSPR